MIGNLTGHRDRVLSARFSSDGCRVTTASRDHTARIWDAASGTETAICLGHKDRVISARFSFDGRRIVPASYDLSARIWNAETGELILRLSQLGGRAMTASFCSQGRFVLTGSYGGVARVWNAATGALVADLKGHSNNSKLLSASFSADGRWIVTASHDGTALLWDAETGQQIATIDTCRDAVNSAEFSPDGRFIAIASDDKTARLWDASRIAVVGRDRAISITAACSRGIGWRTEPERADLAMQDAPDNLYEAALEQLLDPQRHSPEEIMTREQQLKATVSALGAPLHPNCYLTPT
jgi:WD40 repeat protein